MIQLSNDTSSSGVSYKWRKRSVLLQRHTKHARSDMIAWSPPWLRGSAKLKKSKKNLDRAHPTHPPPIQTFFFGNPSLTWTEHSYHNNQQLLAMYVQTEYTWYTTPKYQYWFRAILGWFSKKKKIPSETWTHPPTSIVISDFFLCKVPKWASVDYGRQLTSSWQCRLSWGRVACKRWRPIPWSWVPSTRRAPTSDERRQSRDSRQTRNYSQRSWLPRGRPSWLGSRVAGTPRGRPSQSHSQTVSSPGNINEIVCQVATSHARF